MEEYECKHCNGVSRIEILRDTEKATEPTIEFCPFCGMSNLYAKGRGRLSITLRMIKKSWNELPVKYSGVEIDEFVVMPNHIHGIIVINNVGAGFKPAQIISEKMNTSRAGLKPAPTPK